MLETVIQFFFPAFFILISCVIFGMVVYTVIKSQREKKANDAAPVVTVAAQVKAKRVTVHNSAHQQSANGVPLMTKRDRASYHVVFALEQEQRLELPVSDQQFQRLTEGERGMLTYQRKRFLKFAPEE